MTGPTHELIGVAAAIAACQAADQTVQTTAAVGACAWATSRLPDQLELHGLVPHRTYTHTPLLLLPLIAAVIATATFAGPVVLMVVAGVAIGYAAHLAADACTAHGLPGWPVLERVWLLPPHTRVRTGTWTEQAAAALVFTILATDLYLRYRP
jgi:membrane-bound metal-dependent hydrolase YbcI (DUF457 family)